MTHITCRLTAKNRDQLRYPTLCNQVGATFTFTSLSPVPRHLSPWWLAVPQTRPSAWPCARYKCFYCIVLYCIWDMDSWEPRIRWRLSPPPMERGTLGVIRSDIHNIICNGVSAMRPLATRTAATCSFLCVLCNCNSIILLHCEPLQLLLSNHAYHSCPGNIKHAHRYHEY